MQFVFKSLMDAYCLVKHLENEGKLCRISNANTKCLYMYKKMCRICAVVFGIRLVAALGVTHMLELRELL